jgi:hypothetical protein
MLLERRVLAFGSPGTAADSRDEIIDTPNVGIIVNLCQTDGDAFVDLEAAPRVDLEATTPKEMIQPTAGQGGRGKVGGRGGGGGGGRNSLAHDSRRLIREVMLSLALSLTHSLSHT